MKADESLEQIFKVQAGKLEESYARLKQVMPSYFFGLHQSFLCGETDSAFDYS